MTPLQFLHFDLSDGDDGVVTLDAMASTRAAAHPAVQAEALGVLAWCHRSFPHSEGPVEDGGDWLAELAVTEEAGGWHTLTLTLSGSARFAEAFQQAFPPEAD